MFIKNGIVYQTHPGEAAPCREMLHDVFDIPYEDMKPIYDGNRFCGVRIKCDSVKDKKSVEDFVPIFVKVVWE